jgi:hypothetical protein
VLVVARAAQARPQPLMNEVAYLGSLLFPVDDLVLCMFDGPSRLAVKRTAERIGIPVERLMESIWLDTRRGTVKPRWRCSTSPPSTRLGGAFLDGVTHSSGKPSVTSSAPATLPIGIRYRPAKAAQTKRELLRGMFA